MYTLLIRRSIGSAATRTVSFQTLRTFATSDSRRAIQHRIFDPIRSTSEFDNLNLLSASSQRALITFWTASWCPSCRTISPLLKSLLDEEVFSDEYGVGFAEVQFDSPDIGELASRYAITSIPTLLAFSRQEAQIETRLTRLDLMKDRDGLRRWIADEARHGRTGGRGGQSWLGALLSGSNSTSKP